MTGLKQQARVMAAATREARPMQRFEAWHISYENPRHEGRRIDIGKQASLDDAIAEALTNGSFYQKDVLAVVMMEGESKLVRFYAIKRRSRPDYQRDPVTGKMTALNPLYPSELFTLRVDAFSPVEPWKWTPGADPVGGDRTVINGDRL